MMRIVFAFPPVRSAMSSGLPEANRNKSPCPHRRAGIRAILANHHTENGVFDPPIAVNSIGSRSSDGEHRFPNTVGPEGLQQPKPGKFTPSNSSRSANKGKSL